MPRNYTATDHPQLGDHLSNLIPHGTKDRAGVEIFRGSAGTGGGSAYVARYGDETARCDDLWLRSDDFSYLFTRRQVLRGGVVIEDGGFEHLHGDRDAFMRFVAIVRGMTIAKRSAPMASGIFGKWTPETGRVLNVAVAMFYKHLRLIEPFSGDKRVDRYRAFMLAHYDEAIAAHHWRVANKEVWRAEHTTPSINFAITAATMIRELEKWTPAMWRKHIGSDRAPSLRETIEPDNYAMERKILLSGRNGCAVHTKEMPGWSVPPADVPLPRDVFERLSAW